MVARRMPGCSPGYVGNASRSIRWTAVSVSAAGQLLGATRSGSERAVDAFVVAVADLAGGAVIATVDLRDMDRFAVHVTNVVTADIGHA